MPKTPQTSVTNPSLEYLSHRGPHRTATGPLDQTGISGLVVAPMTGRDLPLIALVHGWLLPPQRYVNTMRYLASWGFVVIAPSTGRGPIPSHAQMSADVHAALRAVPGARLGSGAVTVDGTSCGILGHSIGGSVATLAAVKDSSVKAVMTMTAAPTKPSALAAAAEVTVPGLHVVAGRDDFAPEFGRELARRWAGPTQVRELGKVGHLGLAEGKRLTDRLFGRGAFAGSSKAQAAVRVLATAYFLRYVAGHEQLEQALAGKVAGTKPDTSNGSDSADSAD